MFGPCCQNDSCLPGGSDAEALPVTPGKEVHTLDGPSPQLVDVKASDTAAADTSAVSIESKSIRLMRPDVNEPLGIALNSCSRPNSGSEALTGLYVHSVRPGGFIEHWNKKNQLSQINEGCIITRVNDVDGIPSAMVREMQTKDTCQVYIEVVATK